MHFDQGGTYNEKDLLLRLGNDDEAAFRELYGHYWKKLYSAAFKRIADSEVVKDILQDVFLQVWLRRTSLKIDNLDAYLFGSVRNRVLRELAKEGRYSPIEQLITEIELYGSLNADILVLRSELRKTYLALIETLTPSQQTILKLRFEEDLTTGQIAEIMRISRKTVQNQLRIGLSQIRSSLVILLVLLFC
jgi:RNA polymerase sigma factor (sigma-70 family)